MQKTYAVLAPNHRVAAYASTWNDAVDKAVDLSLRWNMRFSVQRQEPGTLPFQRERSEVLRRAMTYIELARQWPDASRTAKARTHFETAKRKLDRLIQVHSELTGTSK